MEYSEGFALAPQNREIALRRRAREQKANVSWDTRLCHEMAATVPNDVTPREFGDKSHCHNLL
jgi:hypothetical protein